MKIREMEVTDMEQVMAIEQALFSVPWSENGLFSFFYDGDLNRLLSTLAAGNITDLSVSEPDLEEIFFHYYKDGGKKNDPSET